MQKKIVIFFAVFEILVLSGCVSTPYYGSGYYRGVGASYGYQPSFYGTQRFFGGFRYIGHRHFRGGHRHFGGAHRGRSHRGHGGVHRGDGHRHFSGGQRGGGHRH